MTAYEKEIEKLIQAATAKLDQALESTKRASTKYHIKKIDSITAALFDGWLTSPQRIITEEEFVKMYPDFGCHDFEYSRVPEKDKRKTTARTIRDLIEEARKVYGFPITSTPAKGRSGKNTAGYWFPRSAAQFSGYLLRLRPEIATTMLSRIATHDAMNELYGRSVHRPVTDFFEKPRDQLKLILEELTARG